MAKWKTKLKSPFLKRVRLLTDELPQKRGYPFDIPMIQSGEVDLELTTNVTIIAGTNGSGKSTLIEAVAHQCGFGIRGGSRNYNFHSSDEGSELSKCLRLSWLPKVTKGMFIRAETIFEFATEVERLAEETGQDIYDAYGGKSLKERSHGEAFLELFRNRIVPHSIYLMDEPEAALSPTRQVEFLRLLSDFDNRNDTQFIIVTHSPLIMAYPNATLFYIEDGMISKRRYRETEHYAVLKQFYDDPSDFMKTVLSWSDVASSLATSESLGRGGRWYLFALVADSWAQFLPFCGEVLFLPE